MSAKSATLPLRNSARQVGPLPKVAAATRHVLLDIETFSRYVLRTPLYAHQLDPARNATAVYLGTVRTTHDALWQKKKSWRDYRLQTAVNADFFD